MAHMTRQNQVSSKEELTTDLTEDLSENESTLAFEDYEPEVSIVVVTSDSLNVRKEGAANAEKIGILYKGNQVPVLENDEGSPYVKIDFNGVE